MRDILNLGVRLLIISLVAGLLLAATNEVTKGPIAQHEREAFLKVCNEVFPDGRDVKDVDAAKLGSAASAAYVVDASGATLGAVVNVIGKGYGGDLPVMVGVTPQGAITGVRIGTNSETAGLGSRVAEPAFYGQFDGMQADGTIEYGNDVQAITGATISSMGVLNAVNQAVEVARAILADQP